MLTPVSFCLYLLHEKSLDERKAANENLFLLTNSLFSDNFSKINFNY